MSRRAIAIALLCALLLSCKGGGKPQTPQANNAVSAPTTEDMASVNRYLSEKDRAVIEGYGRRNGLDLKASESGFYYLIFEQGKGKEILTKSAVAIAGTVKLIDGTLCYTYPKQAPKTVVVAGSQDMSGLHLALPMLKEGGRALFVFPPNLAFGLLGDGDKIPPRSTVVVDVEVVMVDKQN